MSESVTVIVRKISYIDIDSVFVGEVELDIDDDRLNDFQRNFGHNIKTTIRLNGDPNSSYIQIREMFIREAERLLSIAGNHLIDKDWPELDRANSEAQNERDKRTTWNPTDE